MGAGAELRLMALLETPRAILSVPQYLKVALPRLVGIIFGAGGSGRFRSSDCRACAAPLATVAHAAAGRSAQCLLLARALAVGTIDAVTTQFKDSCGYCAPIALGR